MQQGRNAGYVAFKVLYTFSLVYGDFNTLKKFLKHKTFQRIIHQKPYDSNTIISKKKKKKLWQIVWIISSFNIEKK